MSWECACGITNKDSNSKCQGCGESKENLEVLEKAKKGIFEAEGDYCGKCKYWKQIPQYFTAGYCKRFPPGGTSIGSYKEGHKAEYARWQFSTMEWNDWCGEWENKLIT